MSTLLNKHQESLVNYYLPTGGKLERLAMLFTLFSDCTRLKLLFALTICPMCVGELSRLTAVNRTTVSHQLSFLKREGLLKCKRVERSTVYFVCNESVGKILSAGTEGV